MAKSEITFEEMIGGADMDKLWTNTTPTVAFGAQTINLDLSGYTHIAVDFDNAGTGIFRIGTSGQQFNRITMYQSSRVLIHQRTCYPKTDGVTFNDNMYYSQASAGSAFSESTLNSNLIPLNIYGIKAM